MKANLFVAVPAATVANLPAVRRPRATALCAESFAGRPAASGEPVLWKQLAREDARGEVCEFLLRFALVGVLISTMLTGILH